MNRHIEIVAGDDYSGVRAVGGRFGYDLTGVTEVRFIVMNNQNCLNQLPVLDVAGSVLIDSSNVQINLKRQDTLKLKSGVRQYTFLIKGLLIDGGVITLERGIMTVLNGGI
jgi:hypothetical protein